VFYCQNTIGYSSRSLTSDFSLPSSAANCQEVSELSFSSWRRGNERLSTKAMRPNENLMSNAPFSLPPERRANAYCSRRISSSELGALLPTWPVDFLAFDLACGVFDSHLSATQALSLCLHQSSGRGQPERMLRSQGLGRSVHSVESGGCRAWTRQARGARVHIELSRSMRHRRDGFSRTRSLFLRARYGRGRPGDCGWTR